MRVLSECVSALLATWVFIVAFFPTFFLGFLNPVSCIRFAKEVSSCAVFSMFLCLIVQWLFSHQSSNIFSSYALNSSFLTHVHIHTHQKSKGYKFHTVNPERIIISTMFYFVNRSVSRIHTFYFMH